MIGSACNLLRVCVHVCVRVAPGSLHVVVILGLMKEFQPPPPSLPTTGVRFGEGEKDGGGGLVKAHRG